MNLEIAVSEETIGAAVRRFVEQHDAVPAKVLLHPAALHKVKTESQRLAVLCGPDATLLRAGDAEALVLKVQGEEVPVLAGDFMNRDDVVVVPR